MNVREGFARLARVTAIAYWVGCGIWVASVWHQYMQTYKITPSGTGTYPVFDWGNLADATMQAGCALFFCAIAYIVLLVTFRGVRWIALGFMQKPA